MVMSAPECTKELGDIIPIEELSAVCEIHRAAKKDVVVRNCNRNHTHILATPVPEIYLDSNDNTIEA